MTQDIFLLRLTAKPPLFLAAGAIWAWAMTPGAVSARARIHVNGRDCGRALECFAPISPISFPRGGRPSMPMSSHPASFVAAA